VKKNEYPKLARYKNGRLVVVLKEIRDCALIRFPFPIGFAYELWVKKQDLREENNNGGTSNQSS